MPTVKPKFRFSVSDFGRIPDGKAATAAREVKDFVKDQILEFVSDLNSPVSGHRRFKSKKDGSPSFLEDTGDMLDALEVKTNGSFIEVFVSGDFENDKSSGHNQHVGGEHPFLPTRRYIPDELVGEHFKQQIKDGIRDIVKRFEPEGEDLARELLTDAFGSRQIDAGLDERAESIARDVLAGIGGIFGRG